MKKNSKDLVYRNGLTIEQIDSLGDSHISTSVDTPLRDDAFAMDDETKMELIEEKFADIMQILGLDLSDDSLSGTPRRIAKMYVKEIFSGMDPKNKPKLSLFENKYKYDEMLIEKDISFNSTCEHHFLPIVGKAHVAYVSSGKVIGLSKLNRIVQYYGLRPQVQERMTVQIAEELKQTLDTEHVAVIIDAEHLCVTSRGVQDSSSRTITSQFSGIFREDEARRAEFLQLVNSNK